MSGFEYKVVPAPTKGLKAKGMRSTADRFANALQAVMNEQAAEGWEYQRTDTLPCEEREGLMGKTTVFQNMLVFRRALAAEAEVEEPAPAEIVETAEARVTETLERPAEPPLLEKPKAAETEAETPVEAPAPAPRPNVAAE